MNERSNTPDFETDPERPSEKDLLDRELSEIKQEGLSGQQLRMARRLAQKHGLTPNDDYDAVRLLRAQGIDPFGNTVARKLETPKQGREVATARANQTGEVATDVTAAQVQRNRELARIQSEMRRRNRKRIYQFLSRMFAFIILPTILAGYYFYAVATPMYATKSEFSVETADGLASAVAPSLFGGALSGAVDSIKVQDYLTSKEVMTRLDREEDFFKTFQDEYIDAIQRMEPTATNEVGYKTYKKQVLVGFDPSEGVIRMEVIAPSAESSLNFATALLRYAEQRVDEQTDRIQSDQVTAANQIYKDAEAEFRAAQFRVVELQEKRGIISSDMEIGAQMGQINSLESQILEERLGLAELENNTTPNEVRVRAAKARIALLERNVSELRSELTDSTDRFESFARIAAELEQAEAEVLVRQQMLAQSLQTKESAQIEAARQTKYLTIGVNPILPQDPSYPRKFENTLLSFLLFSAIYLFISITVSILREQVTS